MGEKIKLIDPFLGVGIVISVSVAVILLLIGQARINSLIVGLLTTSITLSISVIARLQQSEKRILEGGALGSMLLNDRELYAAILQIVTSYRAAQQSDFDLFVEKSKETLLECREILGGLEQGYAIVEPGGKFSYGKRGVLNAQTVVKAVDYEDIGAWRTAHMQDVIRANAETTARGIKIQRLFIAGDESLAAGCDVLQAHLEAKAEVYTVSPNDLPSRHLLESYQIVDDKVLVIFYYTRDGKSFIQEKVSIDPIEVSRAIGRFDATFRRARAYQPKDENLG